MRDSVAAYAPVGAALARSSHRAGQRVGLESTWLRFIGSPAANVNVCAPSTAVT